MNQIMEWIKKNNLFFKIVMIVSIGIMAIALFIVIFVTKITEASYINTYSNANEILLRQINNDYDSLHDDVINTLNRCDTNAICKSYLSDDYQNSKEESENTYLLQQLFKDSGVLSNNISSNLLLVGFNEKTFLNNASMKTLDASDIIKSDIVQNALKTPEQIYYQYSDIGFTTNVVNGKAIVAVKVLRSLEDKHPYGVAIVILNQKEFKDVFDLMIDRNVNSMYVLHKDGQILSSNQNAKIGTFDEALLQDVTKQVEEKIEVKQYHDQEKQTVIVNPMPFYDSYLVSVVHDAVFISSVNKLPSILMVCGSLTLIVLIGVFFMIKRTMQPIRLLSKKMPEVINGNFNNHIVVKGSGEVKELSEAFNFMLDGLNDYVNKMIKLQEEKRLSEIHALQMQINPHFIYNTLTSIKFMIWQGNKEKTIQTIDAFIQLLRNTISNFDEVIPVDQEIKNIKNYVQIQSARYGDKVSVNYFIQEECNSYAVLKMVLQPFLENAFFHAFNELDQGVIDVFAKLKKDCLIFEVIDNGAGIDALQIEQMKEKPNEKGRHFSGIGYHNVNERIQLLYGLPYGVSISSTKGQGTIVTIRLPLLPL